MTQYTTTLATPSVLSSQETRRQHTVARLLGVQSFAAIAWPRLMQDGALVQLHIGRCRFTARLLLEEMGIQVEDASMREKLSRWMILGEKRLLPEDYMKALARIESSARYALKEHAFRTEMGNFVPVTAYEAWRTKTEALRTEYLALRDRIIDHHRDLTRQVVTEYEAIATDTYRRLRATHPDLIQESEPQFVTSYGNRIAGQIPSVARIRDSFSFRFFRVDGTQQLGTAPATGSASTEVEQAREGEDETLALQRLHTEQRARSRAILEQDVRQDAQQRVNAMLDDFLTSMVGQLRVLTYDAVTDVLATLKRRGGDQFSPRSTLQLSNLLEQIRRLNFYGDAEIDQMMTRVQQIVDLSPDTRRRSIGDVERTLRAIATTTRATLLDLEAETRTPPAHLGIAAFPTEQLVHVARAELRLPPLDPARLATLAPDTRSRAELTGADGSLWHYVEQTHAARSARTL